MKLGCITCGCLPVVEVGDGDVNRPISAYGIHTVRAQADLQEDSGGINGAANGFDNAKSGSDDVAALLVSMADFEAVVASRMAALGASPKEARNALLRGGLSAELAQGVAEASALTQRSRTAHSPAWTTAHPGGDLAWEHRYGLAFLEFAAAQLFYPESRKVCAVYQMRQCPPVVLNAARATEYRLAGKYSKSLFDRYGRRPSALAADQDILSFKRWAITESVGMATDASDAECPFALLTPGEQAQRLQSYAEHLGADRQHIAASVLNLSAPERENYVTTMLFKALVGPESNGLPGQCHREEEPLLARVASEARSRKLMDFGELTRRCGCRPPPEEALRGRGSPRLVSDRLSSGMENSIQHVVAGFGYRRGRGVFHVSDLCKLAVISAPPISWPAYIGGGGGGAAGVGVQVLTLRCGPGCRGWCCCCRLQTAANVRSP